MIEMQNYIDDNIADKYCKFSGDFNLCHQKKSNKKQKRVIHGGLICDTSLRDNINLQEKKITRLKIIFNNLLYTPAYFRTKLIKKEKIKSKFSLYNKENEIINYETFFFSQKFPHILDKKNFHVIDESKIPVDWEYNFKKNELYRLKDNSSKDNFYDDSKMNPIYSSSLGILSQIVGMYIPGEKSTSLIYDIYYLTSNDPNIYLKIINYIPSLCLLKIIIETASFRAIIHAKNESPH